MAMVVRGRPVALVGFTEDMLPVTRGTRVDADTYEWAVGAFAAAPSDMPACVANLAPQVRGTLARLERADAVPGAFGRALQALDDDRASRTGTAEVSDPVALVAAFEAALADPEASVLDLREAAGETGEPAIVAWGRFVVEFVAGASATTTGVDAAGQLARWANRPVTWLDLVITESNFDAYGGRGRWAGALDASADAAMAAQDAVKARPTFVEDALRSVPRAGVVLGRVGTGVGVGGALIGAGTGIHDLTEGDYVDVTVAIGGAAASLALVFAPLGPVGLGAVATVAVGSIVYEHRRAIGGAAVATVHAVGDAASAVGDAVSGAAGALGRGAGRLWPW